MKMNAMGMRIVAKHQFGRYQRHSGRATSVAGIPRRRA